MDWFGSLDLAFKYAIVFASLLVLTLLAGVIKIVVDRRRVAHHAKKMELEGGQRERDSSQDELNMREQDEGDLFGIRAIEAGFFGGVVQSQPTSVANSPAGSRSVSPVQGHRMKSHNGSVSTLLGTGSSNQSIAVSRSFSDGPLSSQGAKKNPQTHAVRNSRSEADMRSLMVPPNTNQARLRPSQAELSGRLNHNPIDMSLEMPPSPTCTCPPSHHGSQSPSPSSSPPDSYSLSYRQREPSIPRVQLRGSPSDRQNIVTTVENPYDAHSMRGSITPSDMYPQADNNCNSSLPSIPPIALTPFRNSQTDIDQRPTSRGSNRGRYYGNSSDESLYQSHNDSASRGRPKSRHFGTSGSDFTPPQSLRPGSSRRAERLGAGPNSSVNAGTYQPSGAPSAQRQVRWG